MRTGWSGFHYGKTGAKSFEVVWICLKKTYRYASEEGKPKKLKVQLKEGEGDQDKH